MLKKLVTKVLQQFWRQTRGLTMGAQAMVFDGQNRVLLVRHGYHPGWHFPGGGVECNEVAAIACRRELLEETGVVCNSAPELFGFYANFKAFPSDHIALFTVRQWHQPVVPQPNREIVEQGFFALDQLPDGTSRAVRNRLVEQQTGCTKDPMWLPLD